MLEKTEPNRIQFCWEQILRVHWKALFLFSSISDTMLWEFRWAFEHIPYTDLNQSDICWYGLSRKKWVTRKIWDKMGIRAAQGVMVDTKWCLKITKLLLGVSLNIIITSTTIMKCNICIKKSFSIVVVHYLSKEKTSFMSCFFKAVELQGWGTEFL